MKKIKNCHGIFAIHAESNLAWTGTVPPKGIFSKKKMKQAVKQQRKKSAAWQGVNKLVAADDDGVV